MKRGVGRSRLTGRIRISPGYKFGFLWVALLLAAYLLEGSRQQVEIPGSDEKADVAHISGKVFDAGLRIPVEGAQVTAVRWDDKPGRRDYHSADSRADGSFVLAKVPPGRYIVSADKDGYLDASRVIVVSSSGDVTTEILLRKPASIAGRVLDRGDHGVPGIRLGAWEVAHRYGRPWIMQVGRAVTDETGNYQIGRLRSGTYFVGALPESLMLQQGVSLRSESQPRSVRARTFYPGVESLDAANGIPLEEGQQLTGIDITMRTTNGYCITGLLPDWIVREGDVVVSLSESGSRTELAIGSGRMKATKQFRFCGVPSGDYVLYGDVAPSERTTSWVASEPITVDKRDVTAEPLSFEQARELRGQIVVDKDQLIGQRPPEIGVQLEPVDRPPFADEDTTPKIESGGQLVSHRLYSGKYWVNITSISPGYYVSKISAGARDGLRQPVEIGQGDLIITVRSDGPSLAGIVSNEDGSELPPSTRVALVDASTPGGAVRSAPVDQTGRFSFDNLAPGSYSLIALCGLAPEDAENPSVISRFLSQAKHLDLAAYTSQEVQLHPVQTR